MIRRTALPATLLALAWLAGASMAATAETPRPTWVVDPAVPGDNLPPVGRSLFDRTFAVKHGAGAEIELPFPFAALLARLDSLLERDPASALPPAKRVLIPLGRSLQRTAAAPDYFAYPRVVVAVDSPPTPGAPLLKDRLYIGYQEKSAVLEVISYNEAAGRFEFQLVKDYRAGGKPRVVYAPRTLCFACHQNGAPIFSRALWDETNANPRVAAELAATGKAFYGIPPERGVDIPSAIDNATERANRFALTQRLWREGCGDDTPDARHCRAGLFAAAVTHTLSGSQRGTPDPAFEQAVAAPVKAEARRRWPGGLAVGNPDLPNRNPLQPLAIWPADPAAQIAAAHVPAAFDPLLPRPPREIWQPAAPQAEAQVVADLAEFVAATDARRLESALARRPEVPVTALSLPCRVETMPAAARWALRCSGADGSLEGHLDLRAGRPSGGQLQRLTLSGGTAINSLQLVIPDQAGGASLRLLPRSDGRVPRTAQGDAIIAIELRRNGGQAGQALVTIRQESIALRRAVIDLAGGADAAELFGPAPFPRERLFAALMTALGAPAAPPCCAAALALPAPALEIPAAAPGQPVAAGTGPGVEAFHPYCAACHRTAETFPPNFLHGSPAEAEARLRHCAPRLYVRLVMADFDPELREKTPMPPQSLLPAFATDTAGWRGSPARAGLLARVADWLRAETGRPPDLDRLLAAGYEALRPCLPPP
jgi:mono/diheme cytochrome c family protein